MSRAASQPAQRRDDLRIRHLGSVLRRHRVLSFGVPVVVLVATVAFVALATPIYNASTSIRIDQQKSNIALLETLQTLSAGGSEINTEMEVLQSRTLAEQVVDSLNLQLLLKRPRKVNRGEVLAQLSVTREAPASTLQLSRQKDGRFALDVAYKPRTGAAGARLEAPSRRAGVFRVGERVELEGVSFVLAPGAAEHEEIRAEVVPFQTAVRALLRTLSVSRPNREANIVTVSYESPDSELVRDVANTIAGVFIWDRQEVRRSEARSRVTFLNDQIGNLAGQLSDAEDALRSFREGEGVVDLEAEAGAQLKRMADMQAQRDLIESERSALAKLVAEVQGSQRAENGAPSRYRDLLAFPSLLRNQAAADLLGLLNQLENNRAALLLRRTSGDPEVRNTESRIRDLEGQLQTIATTYLGGLTNQQRSLEQTLESFGPQLAAVPAKEITVLRLQRQTELLGEIFSLLQTRLKEAEIAAAIEDVSVRVVDPAILPQKPVRPKRSLSLMLAVLLGLTLGVGTAMAREYMDTSIHTREDLQQAAGLAVLGLIPRIHAPVPENGARRRWRFYPVRVEATVNGRGVPEYRLVTTRDPRSPVSEAYRSLRTNITFSNLERTPKTLVFTSAMPGDGKSTTAMNLAITLTQQGMRILLIDADMRRGSLHEVFDAARTPGLSEVLLGSVALEDALQRADLGTNGKLELLTTGSLPPNPAELLGSARMHQLLARLREEYDSVILDAPPLNVVTDAAILGSAADGVLLVARAGVTEESALAYALEQLANVRAPVLGTVLNDIDYKRQTHYGPRGSYAYHYYGTDEPS